MRQEYYDRIDAIKAKLTERLKGRRFRISLKIHSIGFRQPTCVTFYLDFHPKINGSGCVSSEGLDVTALDNVDALADRVMNELQAAYIELLRQEPIIDTRYSRI